MEHAWKELFRSGSWVEETCWNSTFKSSRWGHWLSRRPNNPKPQSLPVSKSCSWTTNYLTWCFVLVRFLFQLTETFLQVKFHSCLKTLISITIFIIQVFLFFSPMSLFWDNVHVRNTQPMEELGGDPRIPQVSLPWDAGIHLYRPNHRLYWVCVGVAPNFWTVSAGRPQSASGKFSWNTPHHR